MGALLGFRLVQLFSFMALWLCRWNGLIRKTEGRRLGTEFLDISGIFCLPGGDRGAAALDYGMQVDDRRTAWTWDLLGEVLEEKHCSRIQEMKLQNVPSPPCAVVWPKEVRIGWVCRRCHAVGRMELLCCVGSSGAQPPCGPWAGMSSGRKRITVPVLIRSCA